MRRIHIIGCAAAILLAGALVSQAADISGKTIFEGKAPRQKKVDVGADPYCAEQHADKPLRLEDAVVGEAGGLKNVFVYVKSGLEGKKFDVPKDPVILDQEGCHYVPHVFGIQIGQTLLVRNSDSTLHNIHSTPADNTPLNIAQPKKGDQKDTKFDKVEVMVPFKCDVHPWMSCYAGVLDHPFFAVTGDDGAFAIKGLPAGKYVIEAVHEKFGAQTTEVTVGADDKKEVEFKFKSE